MFETILENESVINAICLGSFVLAVVAHEKLREETVTYKVLISSGAMGFALLTVNTILNGIVKGF